MQPTIRKTGIKTYSLPTLLTHILSMLGEANVIPRDYSESLGLTIKIARKLWSRVITHITIASSRVSMSF